MGRDGTGVISSYNYPFDYKHNQTCIYEIYVGQTENTGKVFLVGGGGQVFSDYAGKLF